MSKHKYALLAALLSTVLIIYFYRTDNLAAVIVTLIISSAFYTIYRIIYFQSTFTSKELSSTGGEKDEYEPMLSESISDITFENVAGMDEIKEELMEISDYIANPKKYEKFGAKLPKGILFYGPPGTGKTLIAKALANESGTDFIYASGSEFIEKYVGVGAGRIRTLFEKARKKKNCIIFIDEIDAIGASRNADSNSERDQTLNQLLIELDGFNKEDGIVVIGATNRMDLLDKALIRPGRFDRHIYVGNPSEISRKQILSLHLKGKPISQEVDVESIATRTASMSSAQLANIVNEAALLAVRNSRDAINNADFDEAILKVTAGLKNKTLILSEKDSQTVAYHEAGHAMAHIAFCNNYPQQISIEPRSMSLGLVMTGSKKDSPLLDSDELENDLCVLLAGRASEEILLNRITTGAQNDIKRANELAMSMFCEFGMDMSHKNKIILDNCGSDFRNISEHYTDEMLRKCYERCCNMISENSDTIKRIAEILQLRKKIYHDEIIDIVENSDKILVAE